VAPSLLGFSLPGAGSPSTSTRAPVPPPPRARGRAGPPPPPSPAPIRVCCRPPIRSSPFSPASPSLCLCIANGFFCPLFPPAARSSVLAAPRPNAPGAWPSPGPFFQQGQTHPQHAPLPVPRLGPQGHTYLTFPAPGKRRRRGQAPGTPAPSLSPFCGVIWGPSSSPPRPPPNSTRGKSLGTAQKKGFPRSEAAELEKQKKPPCGPWGRSLSLRAFGAGVAPPWNPSPPPCSRAPPRPRMVLVPYNAPDRKERGLRGKKYNMGR